MDHPGANLARGRRHSGASDLGFPPEHLDVELAIGEVVDLGDGAVRSEIVHVYRWKETGEVAHERRRRIELTVRDGKISRYEMRVVG